MSMTVVNHLTRALSLLASQYKGADNLRSIVSAIATECDQLETVLQDLYAKRALSTAEGEQLDGVGRIVDLERDAWDDATYRLLLHMKIGANMSEGNAETMLQITSVAMGGVRSELYEIFPARFSLLSINPDPLLGIQATKDLVNTARCSSVAMEYLATVTTPAFAFLDDPDTETAGFGDLTDPTAGGNFASII